MSEQVPIFQRPVVYSVEGMEQVKIQSDLVYACSESIELKMDVYIPPDAGQRLLGVIFIHGGPVPRDMPIKDSGQYTSWGRLVAASGMVGFTFNRRYSSFEELGASSKDLECAIAFARQNAAEFSLDPDRLCLWAASGGGVMLSQALQKPAAYIRCLVIYYALLDLCDNEDLLRVIGSQEQRRYSPAAQLNQAAESLPIFIARAGKDDPSINSTIDCFVEKALSLNLNLELHNHPNGQHAFDILDDHPRSRQIIRRTLEFMLENT